MGSGGVSGEMFTETIDVMRERGIKRAGPYRVTQIMASTVSACVATPFKIKGVNYALASACATSAHCIGHAAELIQLGKQDVMFAGGGEELHWTMSALFDAMGALSTQYNDTPQRASRAYDADRDGFVIAGGGGMLVLESLAHATARGAPILAELVGYGATSDGYDMVAPSGEGAVRCMQQAMHGLEGKIDYINAHGTGTAANDKTECAAVADVFGPHADKLMISSTKSMHGHLIGGTGAVELLACIMALRDGVIAPTIGYEEPDPECALDVVPNEARDADVDVVLSNAFAFGGLNAVIALRK